MIGEKRSGAGYEAAAVLISVVCRDQGLQAAEGRESSHRARGQAVGGRTPHHHTASTRAALPSFSSEFGACA